MLKEAEVCADGDRLGPLGGLVVAEVLDGLVRADPESYRTADPGWTPSLPAAGEHFGLAGLLAFADEVAART